MIIFVINNYDFFHSRSQLISAKAAITSAGSIKKKVCYKVYQNR